MYARNKTNLHLVFHILFREHARELPSFATFAKVYEVQEEEIVRKHFQL